MELLLLVDTWPPSGCFVVSVSGLGDIVLPIGSPVSGHLVGLGGLVRFSLLFCGRHSASSVVVCFHWPFFGFFSVVSPLCACGGQLLFGQHQGTFAKKKLYHSLIA